MKNNLIRIFWGLLILLIDIRVGPFDIVNDLFGYILLVNSTLALYESTKERSFNKSAWLMLLLAFLHLIWILMIGLEGAQHYQYAVGAVFLLLKSLFIYFVYLGLINTDVEITEGNFKQYFVVSFGSAFVFSFLMNLEHQIAISFYVTGVLIISELLMIVGFRNIALQIKEQAHA